jgi:hypothetical protein
MHCEMRHTGLCLNIAIELPSIKRRNPRRNSWSVGWLSTEQRGEVTNKGKVSQRQMKSRINLKIRIAPSKSLPTKTANCHHLFQ